MRVAGNEAARLWMYEDEEAGAERGRTGDRKGADQMREASVKPQRRSRRMPQQGQRAAVPVPGAGTRGQDRETRQEHIKRQNSMLQMQMQRQAGKGRRLTVSMILIWCLLTANLIFLLILYRKVSDMDERLNRAVLQARVASEADQEETVQHTDSQTPPQAADVMGQTVQAVKGDYPDIWGLDRVDSPRQRTERQVLDRLEELAAENDLIGEIYSDRGSYPDKLLEALANNPEMAGFVAGYPDGKPESSGLTKSEREKEFPLFLQWDPRWGYESYGDGSNIGLAGCGPTCISMALYYLTGDESLTPDVIGDYSMKNGYYVSGVGTAWALLEEVPAMYGVEVMQQSINEENLKQALDWGGVAICSMSEGDFTAAGHFIVIYGYDSDGFLVNDPNCVARSRQHWDWDSLRRQIKNVWVYQNG